MKIFFRIVLILATCYFLSYFRQKPKNQPRVNSPKVLIIQLAKLGDMVCTTPMFRAVKKTYPEARITVVGNVVNKELLAGNRDVDEYIVWDKKYPFSILNDIKKGKFDFGCVTAPGFDALSLILLANIPMISAPRIENGWSPYETRSYRLLRKLVIAKPHRMRSYAPREYLKLLEPIGVFTDDTKKHLYYSEKAAESVSVFIDGVDFPVGISPSAGNRIKQWPAEKFSSVADHLSDKHKATVVIIGGPNDNEEANVMFNHLGHDTRVINLVGRLNIEETKAFISKLKLFISADTGPIYIAEAFGVPTIDIVGPVDENEQPPISRFHKVIVPSRKGPELFVMNARVYDTEEAKRQAKCTPVSIVNNEIDLLISDIIKQ